MRLSRLFAGSVIAIGVVAGPAAVAAHADSGHENIGIHIDNNNPLGLTCITIFVGQTSGPPILGPTTICLPV